MRSISFEEATAVGGGMIGAGPGSHKLEAGNNPSSDAYSTWGPPRDYDRSNDVDSIVVTATRLPNVENPGNCLATVDRGITLGTFLGGTAAGALGVATGGTTLVVSALAILGGGAGFLGGGAIGAGSAPCQPPRG
jgi:hypothetical protein